MFKKIFNFLLDLIFPIECLGCNQEDVYLCPDCYKKIQINSAPPPFKHPLKYLNGVLSAGDYHQVLLKNVIHCFKFRFTQELAEPLAKILAEFWDKQINGNNNVPTHNCASLPIMDNPIIMPVPLNKKRLLERGFNQAELIAKIFAEQFNYLLLTEAVIRQKNTAHQLGLNQKERTRNIQGAFQINQPELIKDKIIILIDDVVTTGSTLQEIAKVLKEGGAKEVWGLAVAKD
ncbi:MAG: phosphoribosyltransferase family protein [Candidatus Komeilibacteria bacterium]|nr:phosphoribosyltransferase family protein [Candidatus Komeilibacteria bacterium]